MMSHARVSFRTVCVSNYAGTVSRRSGSRLHAELLAHFAIIIDKEHKGARARWARVHVCVHMRARHRVQCVVRCGAMSRLLLGQVVELIGLQYRIQHYSRGRGERAMYFDIHRGIM